MTRTFADGEMHFEAGLIHIAPRIEHLTCWDHWLERDHTKVL